MDEKFMQILYIPVCHTYDMPMFLWFYVLVFPDCRGCSEPVKELFSSHCVKVSKYGVIFGPYFPAFGLNPERYFVSLRFQSECGKIRTRKNSIFGHFSRSVRVNGSCSDELEVNPLSANFTKWSNTLKQFVGSFLSVFGHFVGLAFKGLKLVYIKV